LDSKNSFWLKESNGRLALARGLLARLPEPTPPVVDGKTPGDIAYDAFINGSDSWEAAASAVLAAFGQPSLDAAIARMEAVPLEELNKTYWNSGQVANPEWGCDRVRARLIAAAREGPAYAKPAPVWQPAMGEANPVQDMALGGQMYWRDLAHQLAEVWWKCHNIGASLQHGDIDTDVSFSVVCEQHGGQVFHADTPHNAWIKAEKWLMSPNRASFPACLTTAKEEQP
jgi:hypothetical protein